MPPRIGRLCSRLRTRPELRDGLVAVVLLMAGLPQFFLDRMPAELGYRAPDARGAALIVVITCVVTLRQRFPMTVLLLVMAGELALGLLSYPPSVADVIAFLLAIYSVAAHRALAHSAVGGALALVGLNVMLAALPERASLVAHLTNSALLVGVWWVGRSLRLRRAYLAELEDRTARLERARGSDARAARVEERSRIARELHDVVAHHVSVMTVQAGAARRVLDRNPEGAREALSTIEEVGRTALSEMRRIVGVLRTDRDPERSGGELAPQPGMGDVGELVDAVRETGMSVQLWVEGETRSLSPGVDLAAFRLIQEALTNTLKHGGPQVRAWVRLRYTERDLTVEVEDDGRGAAACIGDNGDNPGHGLVGMSERVALYGGELRIGPRLGGGFGVRARFPLET